MLARIIFRLRYFPRPLSESTKRIFLEPELSLSISELVLLVHLNPGVRTCTFGPFKPRCAHLTCVHIHQQSTIVMVWTLFLTKHGLDFVLPGHDWIDFGIVIRICNANNVSACPAIT
jgi:hypothetical protein